MNVESRGLRGVGGRWLLGLAMLALLVACSRTPPEQRLREQLSAMQVSLETRDTRGFMAGVAEDFSGGGGIDRAALQQLVRAQVLANAQIGVTLGPAEIQLHGDGASATVRFTAMTTGGSGRFVPERGRVHDVTSGWRDVDGQWQLYSAEWAPRL